ncbi:MAG TPA: glycine cleavage system protein GcvH [Clostridiales bacterium]|nr:glycine cleavage system protein GcvH [Clostridiales bacterium]
MEIKENLKYSRDHEWVKIEGDKVYIGITDYAQDSLGDVVFVELPEVGDTFDAGDDFAVVESVKAASDIYTPVSGTVVEINEELENMPEMVNEAPYESWFIALEIDDPSELDSLMDWEEYQKFCEEEEA